MRATLDSITGQNEDALTELDTSQNEPDATDTTDTAETFIERMGFSKVLMTTYQAAGLPPPSPRRDDEVPSARPCSDLYGQQIIPAALADPAAKENTDLPYRAVQRPGLVRARHDRADGRPEAVAEQTKTARALRGVMALIDKTNFGYVTSDDAVAQLRPGGRPARSHVRSRWQRPPATPHPDVPAGRRVPAAQSPFGTLGRFRRATSPSLQRPDGQPAAGVRRST